MRVLLSIKPVYANLIFSGKKKFEFRRTIFKNQEVKTVVVYASTPIKKVIGEFEIDYILNDEINILWTKTQENAGINKDVFFQYFNGKEFGYAIKIKNLIKYEKPLSLKDNFHLNAPQSFAYLI
jgi:predicted transcriptional regulator